jgi:ABC-type transporter Mla MlaB component
MKYSTDGTYAYLKGDLNHSGVTHCIVNSLAVSLQKIESIGEKNIRIDCRGVRSADVSGLQLLQVWMNCASFRGVEPELVNLPEGFQQIMQIMGLRYCLTDGSLHS